MPQREIKAALASPEFSEQVGEAVLTSLTEGLQGHSVSKTKALFDAASFSPAYFDHMNAAFNFYDSFRVYCHMESATAEGGKGEITADFRLESVPAQQGVAARRRQTTLRLTVEKISAGPKTRQWRITSMEPSDFLFEF